MCTHLKSEEVGTEARDVAHKGSPEALVDSNDSIPPEYLLSAIGEAFVWRLAEPENKGSAKRTSVQRALNKSRERNK